ncbi:tyrosine-protein phosphatase [Lolliginicoccus suaedae]|uniref:tyrosine-protein phosphatase n=1 Tax=Lolliginicoccus suaedae TaxID=2605429 RepID=UPI0016599A31|nr:tyrosine-protein phosphatase [Lolliginicoccus suaedae]
MTIPNLQDLGAHAASLGLPGRPGLVFRSAQLGGHHGNALDGLGVRTVVDLRTASERASMPTSAPGSVTITVADVFARMQRSTAARFAQALHDPEHAAEFLASGSAENEVASAYRLFITDEGARDAFRETLLAVARSQAPVLFHCTAGKDRTGWAATLLLAIAGLDRDQLLEHYLSVIPATDALFAPIYDAAGRHGIARELLYPVLRVQPSFLETAWATLDETYGDLSTYFSHGLGLLPADIEVIRGKLLEPR